MTIGAFDGVHVGHQHLISAMKARAQELSVASAVVTFDRHPASVVRPESAPKLLVDLDQKLELLAQTGVDYTLVVPFDKARADEEAEDFVNEVFVDRLGAKAVFVGYDFHFGRARRGNAELLDQMGAELGFEVHTTDPLKVGSEVVSSTLIRRLVSSGELVGEAGAPSVEDLMGRHHEVRGLVTMGDGRGRELGYPTANVALDADVVMPAFGVYAGRYVTPDGQEWPAAISYGTRPTFYEQGAGLLEAHLLDFNQDLYGQHCRVRFHQKVRDQVRFDSVDALVRQMDDDAAAVRRVMRAHNPRFRTGPT